MEACDTSGAVRIKRRDGRTYTLQAEQKKKFVFNPPDIMGRLKKQFPGMKIGKKHAALADKRLAGE